MSSGDIPCWSFKLFAGKFIVRSIQVCSVFEDSSKIRRGSWTSICTKFGGTDGEVNAEQMEVCARVCTSRQAHSSIPDTLVIG